MVSLAQNCLLELAGWLEVCLIYGAAIKSLNSDSPPKRQFSLPLLECLLFPPSQLHASFLLAPRYFKVAMSLPSRRPCLLGSYCPNWDADCVFRAMKRIVKELRAWSGVLGGSKASVRAKNGGRGGFGMMSSTGCRERRRSMDDDGIALSALREGAAVLETGREKKEKLRDLTCTFYLSCPQLHSFLQWLQWRRPSSVARSKPGAMTPLPQLEAIATSASSPSNKGMELGPSADSFRAPAYQTPVREEPKVCLFAV
ncbi:hypothetical protein HDK64DRAFT_279396 [Phyllosticta capitalensis]